MSLKRTLVTLQNSPQKHKKCLVSSSHFCGHIICSMGNGLIQSHKVRVVQWLLCSCTWLCLRLLCLSILGTLQSTFLTVKSLTDALNVRVKARGHFQCLISQITQYSFMLLTITFKNQSPIMPKWDGGNLWPWSLQCLSHKACLLLPSLLLLSSSTVLKWLFCLCFSSFWGGQLSALGSEKQMKSSCMLH